MKILLRQSQLSRRATLRFLAWFSLLRLVPAGQAQTIHVDTTPARAIRFDPDQALGSSIDILPASLIDTVYSGPILRE